MLFLYYVFPFFFKLKEQFTEIHIQSNPFDMPTDFRENLSKNRNACCTASSSLSTNTSVFELKEWFLWMLTHSIFVLVHILTRPYNIMFHPDEPLKESLDEKNPQLCIMCSIKNRILRVLIQIKLILRLNVYRCEPLNKCSELELSVPYPFSY